MELNLYSAGTIIWSYIYSDYHTFKGIDDNNTTIHK